VGSCPAEGVCEVEGGSVKFKVPPELITDYERERVEPKMDFSNLPTEKELDEYSEQEVLDGFEGILIDEEIRSEMAQEMHEEISASVICEIRQRMGTRMLYVIEVSDDGEKIFICSSDGSYGVQMGKKP
jgi:hypothetical protein